MAKIGWITLIIIAVLGYILYRVTKRSTQKPHIRIIPAVTYNPSQDYEEFQSVLDSLSVISITPKGAVIYSFYALPESRLLEWDKAYDMAEQQCMEYGFPRFPSRRTFSNYELSVIIAPESGIPVIKDYIQQGDIYWDSKWAFREPDGRQYVLAAEKVYKPFYILAPTGADYDAINNGLEHEIKRLFESHNEWLRTCDHVNGPPHKLYPLPTPTH